ncbi:MAG TPA: T9SS type A sorting domain-containing protein, partial [Bacteroidales bacterium]|nr:T9SS type A sorting domain-containing protein [Bacteroidales bacterium]
PSTLISPDVVTIAPGLSDTTFEGEYRPYSNTGTSTIAYVFFDVLNPADSVYVKVAYTSVFPSNIKENKISRIDFPPVYPNPANLTANFSWLIPSNVSEASIVIRNLLGKIVSETLLENSVGKISVDLRDLPDGIYFYSLILNGNSFITRKLIIKH